MRFHLPRLGVWEEYNTPREGGPVLSYKEHGINVTLPPRHENM